MTITTKFSPGQKVVFLHEGQVYRDTIQFINVSAYKSGEPAVGYYLPNPTDFGLVMRYEHHLHVDQSTVPCQYRKPAIDKEIAEEKNSFQYSY